jgi:hypothetical protein
MIECQWTRLANGKSIITGYTIIKPTAQPPEPATVAGS